jgi:hypothetical protein
MKIPIPTTLIVRSFLIFLTTFSCNYLMAQPALKTGKGYMNITKGLNGGTFEAGDILEIRATISITSGTFATVRYIDTIPANTTYVAGSMRLMSNEGVPYRTYTDAGNDDGGIYNSTNKTLKLHTGGMTSVGLKANSTDPMVDINNAPWLNNASKPSFFGNTSIVCASYRIRINAVSVNTVITTKGGAFYYANNDVPKIAALPAFKLKIVPDLGLCENKVARNSVLEFEGTFGRGTTQKRSTNSTLVPVTGYTYTNFTANSPNDGSYSLVNNTSANGSTNSNAPYGGNVPARVFNIWNIGGDHSGATNTALGNPAVAPGTNGGYMLVVNASYVNGVAITQPVSSLCDETYYEFSAWFRNICKYCGCDADGRGVFNSSGGSTGYTTAIPGDSSGVKPNLTFEIDGESLYTSGDLLYTGQWVKKGFIFKTRPGQNNIVISIRNNSSGGGGNDWAMDDLSLSICGPGIAVTPTMIADCNNNYITMEATVKYFEQNYGAYIWEKSVNGGATWTTTPHSGTKIPLSTSDGQFQYTVQYPMFLTSQSDSGSRYRLRVAANSGNLSSAPCSYIDTTVASLSIFDCTVLPVDLIAFNGNSLNNKNTLNWKTQRELNPSSYTLQRSTDGINYTGIVTLPSQNLPGTNSYRYPDPLIADAKTYYRILIKDLSTGRSKYTSTVTLNGTTSQRPSTINVLGNPFTGNIGVEIFASQEEDVRVSLFDVYGRIIKTIRSTVEAGYKKVDLNGLESYAPGVYALKIEMGNQTITRKVLKK